MTGSRGGVPTSREGRRSAAITTLGGALLVMALAVLAHHALLSAEGFRTRDHVDFYLRVGQYARELAAGYWPQSLPDALRGGGHAFPLYYPPLAHWVALGAHLLGLPLIRASHVAALLSVVLSALFLFLLLRQLTGSLEGAVFGAVCYLVFPYRYQLLQGRGTFAEGWVLTWLPAVVLASRFRESARHLWLPLAIALLLLSHTALSVWTLPMIVLLIWRAESSGDLALDSLKTLARASLVATGLGMFYLLPVLLGLGKVRASDPVAMRTAPSDVSAGEIVFSGLPHPTLMGAVVFTVLVALAIRMFSRRREGAVIRRWINALVVPFLLGAAALAAPEAAWGVTPNLLRFIQSPVRLLGPIGFLVAMMAGLWASETLSGHPTRFALLTLGTLAAGIVLAPSNRERMVPASELAGLPSTTYADLGFTLEGSYLPRGSRPAALAERIETTRLSAGLPPLRSWEKTSEGYEARVDAPRGAVVPLPLVGYDFHDVSRRDGGPVEQLVLDGQLAVLGQGQPVDVLVRRRLSPGVGVGFAISLVTCGLLLGSIHGARFRVGPRRARG